jgi:glycogen phosphorylase
MASRCPDVRTGHSPAEIKQAILDHLQYDLARIPYTATLNDWYMAVSCAVRDRLLDSWLRGQAHLVRPEVKIVGYLSAEFLTGPHLGSNLLNLGLTEAARAAVAELGLDYDAILRQEEEPGLGNGGLGRLAACYLDSLATLRVPAVGYGIRYEFGIFDQEIRDGWQVEVTDKWLRLGNPWEIRRSEIVFTVGEGGVTERYHDADGRERVRWVPQKVIRGVAYDTPVAGYRSGVTNILRLWRSEAVESFDFQAFNVGEYERAVEDKTTSETVSKVLYPNDQLEMGKRLRLLQQHFFVSCSLQDALRVHQLRGCAVSTFAEGFAIQLNDTHPSLAVAELMRLLVDEHGLGWDDAWRITVAALAYTNHTLLPEALERWPLDLFGRLLPRHLEIILEINRRFLDEVRTEHPDDAALIVRVSLIDESGGRSVRMAHLAALGSHAVNGVAALHTELLKQTVLRDFHALFPDRFLNVTNGVTPRRWLALSNPELAALVTEAIGDGWVADAQRQLIGLERLAPDAAFQERWRAVKRRNKARLADVLRERTGVVVDPDSLFDVHVKRLHEYKRQHLNILHVVALYDAIKRDPGREVIPRTFVFGGKAAPGYAMAKLIIKLINAVAEVVNADADVAGRLKVVFFPDFNVTNGQLIYPAADVSEQISTAGKEASGTGNMKFALNGALTVGTLDGANIEIRDAVGTENFFLFGLTAAEVLASRAQGYRPRDLYDADPRLRGALDQIAGGVFSGGDDRIFRPLVANLLDHDEYLVLADFAAYASCQAQVAAAWSDTARWARMSILNVARVGPFSSDRAVREYVERIWGATPIAAAKDVL